MLTETSSRRIFNDAVSLLAIYYCGDQVKNKEMGWNTTYTEERGNAYRLFLGNSEGKGYLEDLGFGGSIILKWVL